MTRSRRTAAGALASILLLVLAATAAFANDLAVDLHRAALSPNGATQLTLSVTGDVVGDDPLDAGAFAVEENGVPIADVEVAPVTQETERPDSTVMILFDVSGSAAGEPIEAARDAAVELVHEIVPAGVEVGLIPFSTSAGISLLPSDDADEVAAAIAALEAGGNTALYDAIVLGSQVLEGRDGERTLVLFTDGADTSSDASLEDATAAANAAEAPIVNVALITPDQDPDVLEALAVDTDGRLLEVEDTAELSSAFAQVAQTFTSQYVVTYVSDDLTEELDIVVRASVGGEEAADGFLVLNTREEQATQQRSLPPPPPATLYDAGTLGTPEALWVGLGIAFLAVLVLLAVLLVPRGDRAATKTLRRGLAITQRVGRDPRPTSAMSASALGRRAMELVSAVPKPEGYEESLQTDIDRAGWQLRASEFMALRVGSAFVGGVVVGVLFSSVLGGFAGFVLGAFVPNVILLNAKQRRQSRFMEQLPDTLQLLAGTLKAGYGPLQGIDTVVKEIDAPMSTEFRRVLTEARLGLPLEDSLSDMAERVGSEDFKWVVVAMNIQRQVGGNLAELLETVADTLRDRQQVRRQIQVLSAEGKLSAIVLVALPFVLLGWMLLTTPSFIMPLISTTVGQLMSAGAAVLMAVGVVWMRKLIRIDV